MILVFIQTHVEQFGYGVVREMVGHGVGENLHEEHRFRTMEKEEEE